MKFIDVNGRGPIFEGGEVRSFPIQEAAHDRSEADILDSLASALRARERIDSAIVNLRILASEFTDRARGAITVQEGTARLRAGLEREAGLDIRDLGKHIAAANEAGKADLRRRLGDPDEARLRAEGEADRALSTPAHALEDAEIRQANDPDRESMARARLADRLAREDDN